MTLGQVKTEEKSNEITAIPQLLQMLELNGCMVTIDGQGGGAPGTAEGTTVQPRYYISSLEASAERLLEVVRTHWSIENSLHWSLDVNFVEDQCSIRKDHAPQNMALLRQVSHNLLKNETSLKVGIQGKRPPGRLERGLPAQSPPRLKRDWPDLHGNYITVAISAYDSAKGESLVERDSIACPELGD